MTLHSEIFEQPQRLASLLANQKPLAFEIAKAIQSRNVQYAFLAARGQDSPVVVSEKILGSADLHRDESRHGCFLHHCSQTRSKLNLFCAKLKYSPWRMQTAGWNRVVV